MRFHSQRFPCRSGAEGPQAAKRGRRRHAWTLRVIRAGRRIKDGKNRVFQLNTRLFLLYIRETVHIQAALGRKLAPLPSPSESPSAWPGRTRAGPRPPSRLLGATQWQRRGTSRERRGARAENHPLSSEGAFPAKANRPCVTATGRAVLGNKALIF